MCPGQTNLNARVYWGMHIEQKACMACMRGCVCIGECGNGGKAGVLGNAGCWETGEMRIGQAKVKEALGLGTESLQGDPGIRVWAVILNVGVLGSKGEAGDAGKGS